MGACDGNKTIPYFCSSQLFTRTVDPLVPDLVGPGVDYVSAVPTNLAPSGLMKMSGTSTATPHIAGLAALLFQALPAATVDQVENAIFRSCIRAADMPQNRRPHNKPFAGCDTTKEPIE